MNSFFRFSIRNILTPTVWENFPRGFSSSSVVVQKSCNCNHFTPNNTGRPINGSSIKLLPILFPTYIQVRNAGHSKWANIRHTKMANDLLRSHETSKRLQAIRVAIREKGSADPKVNKQLADAIEKAKEAKVPQASILRTLDSVKNPKDLKTATWQIKGQGGSSFVVDVMSENLVRTRSELSSAVKKSKAKWTEDIMYQYIHKGVIVCTSLDSNPLTPEVQDTAVIHAIEVDADEVLFENHPDLGNIFRFITDPVNYHKANHALMKMNYTLAESGLYYLPVSLVELEEDDLKLATSMCDKFLENNEVLKVANNIA